MSKDEKLTNNIDLDNWVDPSSIVDLTARFMYLFPFYRLNINVFLHRLNSIKGTPMSGICTEFIQIGDLVTAFKDSKAFNGSWFNIKKLLKTPELKCLTVDEAENIRKESV